MLFYVPGIKPEAPINPHNDVWVLRILGTVYSGYFVEVGAADGLNGSSCAILDVLGWNGICVEPSEYFYRTLVVNRPNSICENVCLWSCDGLVSYYEKPWLGGVEGVVNRNHVVGIMPRQQRAMTFKSLLRKHGAPFCIDFIAIDAEGSEGEILRNFPFDEYDVKLFAIEGEKADEVLIQNGYSAVINVFNDRCPWEHYFLRVTHKLL